MVCVVLRTLQAAASVNTAHADGCLTANRDTIVSPLGLVIGIRVS